MYIALFTVSLLLVWAVTYLLLTRLILPVRVVGACIPVAFLAGIIVIVQNRESVAPRENPSGASDFPTFSNEPAVSVPNSIDDPGLAAYAALQSIIKEDHDFLDKILQSSQFRSSKRCSDFLRYVVEHADHNHTELLKERSLGVEVFERDPHYDTNQDPVVRSTGTAGCRATSRSAAQSGTVQPGRAQTMTDNSA